MITAASGACPYCFTRRAMQQICAPEHLRGGLAFGCTTCGGALFQRAVSLPSASEEYWEGDMVNQTVYRAPEVLSAFTQKYDRYLRLLGTASGRSLLEVGCGSGIFLRAAFQRGWHVHGLDISPQAVELTRRQCPGARLMCASLEKADFKEESFDLVAMWDVIEHVEEPEVLLGHVLSVLKPGGVLLMETPDECCLTRGALRLAYGATRGRVSLLNMLYYSAHRWYFSRTAMKVMLERLGFNTVRFYRERTVNEFARRKIGGYGLLNTWPKTIAWKAASAVMALPCLWNKMVVSAVKQ